MLQLTQGEGEGYVAFSIWSLSALVRQSDVKEWGFFFFLTPPYSPPYLSSLFSSHLDVCDSLILPLSPYTFC